MYDRLIKSKRLNTQHQRKIDIHKYITSPCQFSNGGPLLKNVHHKVEITGCIPSIASKLFEYYILLSFKNLKQFYRASQSPST